MPQSSGSLTIAIPAFAHPTEKLPLKCYDFLWIHNIDVFCNPKTYQYLQETVVSFGIQMLLGKMATSDPVETGSNWTPKKP